MTGRYSRRGERTSGVGEGRVGDQVAEVGALVAFDETLADVGFDGAPGGGGLVGEAAEEGLDDTLFEVDAGVFGDDLIAERVGELVEAFAENVETDAGEEEAHFGLHIV